MNHNLRNGIIGFFISLLIFLIVFSLDKSCFFTMVDAESYGGLFGGCNILIGILSMPFWFFENTLFLFLATILPLLGIELGFTTIFIINVIHFLLIFAAIGFILDDYFLSVIKSVNKKGKWIIGVCCLILFFPIAFFLSIPLNNIAVTIIINLTIIILIIKKIIKLRKQK
ncbi:MAG: hypothetical protein ACP5D2_01260 [Candidatus Nanoarchaeia archaeon]